MKKVVCITTTGLDIIRVRFFLVILSVLYLSILGTVDWDIQLNNVLMFYKTL